MRRRRLAFASLSGAWVLSVAALAEEEAYDPLEGRDEDGRIPYVERPPELDHPRRWRYIPEGRIKPGNVWDRLFVTSYVAPIVFKDSDAGWGGGLAYGDIDFRNQRRREMIGLFGSYSSEQQQSYGGFWRRWLHQVEVPGGGVLQEERSFVQVRLDYRNTRTRRFFGIGPDTAEEDETSYTDSVVQFDLRGEWALPDPGDDLVLSVGARGEFHALSDGIVSGVPNTSEDFPLIFAAAEDDNLGFLTAGVRWDTRDSQNNPYDGWFVGADVDAALAQTEGDVGAVFTLAGSYIFPVPGLFHSGDEGGEENPPTDTFVVGLRAQLTAGVLPFYSLPTLGGRRSLRGYIEGRFRDRASWYADIAYYFWIFERGMGFTPNLRLERVGLGVFYQPGAVAPDAAGLFSSKVRHNYGLSAIASLERAISFRADLGFSEEGMQFTAGYGLSF